MYGLITVIHVSTNRTEILRQRADAVIERFVVDRPLLEISISIARNSQQMQK